MSDWNDGYDADDWESHFAGAELFDEQDEGELDEQSAEDYYLDLVASDGPSDVDLGEAELVVEPPLDDHRVDETLEYAATHWRAWAAPQRRGSVRSNTSSTHSTWALRCGFAVAAQNLQGAFAKNRMAHLLGGSPN